MAGESASACFEYKIVILVEREARVYVAIAAPPFDATGCEHPDREQAIARATGNALRKLGDRVRDGELSLPTTVTVSVQDADHLRGP